jgi:cyclic pyranopterin phosphate synthase
VELRLIEFMDVGNRNGWNAAAVWPAAAMVSCVDAQWPLEPVGRDPHGTAIRWRYRDGGGYLAVVASISAPFCGDCNRLRITADGVAYRCLFAATGSDLKPWLRPSLNATGLAAAMAQLWQTRQDRYSEERSSQPATGPAAAHAEMAYLGG